MGLRPAPSSPTGLAAAWVGPRRDRGEQRLVDPEIARRLVQEAREQGLDIAGDSGLLQQTMKSALEAALAEELTAHLGYEGSDTAGRGTGDSRNSSTSKTLLTEAGPMPLDTPRDRAGTFSRRSCRRARGAWTASTRSSWGSTPGARRCVTSIGAPGDIYDVSVSPDLVSRTTDALHAEFSEWHSRPLDTVYPVLPGGAEQHRLDCYLRPLWAPLMTSCVPATPRVLSERRKPAQNAPSSTLRVLTPYRQASITTANSAWSMRRQRFSSDGKKLPVRSLRICSSRSPVAWSRCADGCRCAAWCGYRCAGAARHRWSRSAPRRSALGRASRSRCGRGVDVGELQRLQQIEQGRLGPGPSRALLFRVFLGRFTQKIHAVALSLSAPRRPAQTSTTYTASGDVTLARGATAAEM